MTVRDLIARLLGALKAMAHGGPRQFNCEETIMLAERWLAEHPAP
jgi:hypothetical protein